MQQAYVGQAKDRERSLRTMAGPVTLQRNYHYCVACQLGFYRAGDYRSTSCQVMPPISTIVARPVAGSV